MPTAWWLRPVITHARVGEHRLVTWKWLYRRPPAARPSMAGVAMSEPKQPSCAEAEVVEDDQHHVGRVGAGMRERVVAGHRLGDREPCVRVGGRHGRAIYAGRGGDAPERASGDVDHRRRRESGVRPTRLATSTRRSLRPPRTGAARRRRRPCRRARTPTGLPSPARPAPGSGARTAAARASTRCSDAARCCRMPMVATSANAWASTRPTSSTLSTREPSRFNEPMTC